MVYCDVVVVLKIFWRSFSVVVLHPIMMAQLVPARGMTNYRRL